MTRDELVEKVARALCEDRTWPGAWDKACEPEKAGWWREASTIVAIVIEEAAKVADGVEQTRDWVPGSLYDTLRRETAAAIRAISPEHKTGEVK